MQHHDPKDASDDDTFEDEPTGKWRVVGAVRPPLRESDPKDEEIEPDLTVELAG